MSTEWLSDDTPALLLAQISMQLSAGLNLEPPTPLVAPPSHSQVVINVLWFSSLILSLNTAVMAILVKQWLSEYSWDVTSVPSSPRKTLAARQIRYEAMSRWRLPDIIGYIPVQLLAAVVLFLAGLVYYILTLSRTAAVVPCLLTGFCFIFLLLTSILPTIFPECSYHSPQSWLLRRLLRPRESGPSSGWSDVLLQISNSAKGTAYTSRALCWVSMAFHYSATSVFRAAWICACELGAPFASHALCELFSQCSGAEQATAVFQQVHDTNYERGYNVLLDGFPSQPSSNDITHAVVIAKMFRRDPSAASPAVGILTRMLAADMVDVSLDERLLTRFQIMKSLVLLNTPEQSQERFDTLDSASASDSVWLQACESERAQS